MASFRATLEEAAEADVLLHVVDVAHHAWEEQAQVVHEVLEDAGVDGTRRVVVALNKADLLAEDDGAERLSLAESHGWEAVLVSAATGAGLDALGRRVTTPS